MDAKFTANLMLGATEFMILLTLVTGGVARLLGYRASKIMIPMGLVTAISVPFLHYSRPLPFGDGLIGWPCIYVRWQGDAGPAGSSLRWQAFFVDLALGITTGCCYLVLRRFFPKRKQTKDTPK